MKLVEAALQKQKKENLKEIYFDSNLFENESKETEFLV
jgi:hypothetical protein